MSCISLDRPQPFSGVVLHFWPRTTSVSSCKCILSKPQSQEPRDEDEESSGGDKEESALQGFDRNRDKRETAGGVGFDRLRAWARSRQPHADLRRHNIRVNDMMVIYHLVRRRRSLRRLCLRDNPIAPASQTPGPSFEFHVQKQLLDCSPKAFFSPARETDALLGTSDNETTKTRVSQ